VNKDSDASVALSEGFAPGSVAGGTALARVKGKRVSGMFCLTEAKGEQVRTNTEEGVYSIQFVVRSAVAVPEADGQQAGCARVFGLRFAH